MARKRTDGGCTPIVPNKFIPKRELEKNPRTDGGCTPIVPNKFIPKHYKVQVEMTIKRVIEVEVYSETPRSARRVLSSGLASNAGARDLQEADPGDMSMGAQYKVIGVEEIEFDA